MSSSCSHSWQQRFPFHILAAGIHSVGWLKAWGKRHRLANEAVSLAIFASRDEQFGYYETTA
ncbi:MAG: hypothetical protein AAGA40_16735, partial [Cyanobacteria bacterium P01_E01_bin.45]